MFIAYRYTPGLIGFIFSVLISCAEETDLNPVKDNFVSRSSSRQFIVHGKDSKARGAVCVFCEEVKGDLLSLMRQSDRWRYSVVIQLRGDTTNIKSSSIKPSIYKLPGGTYRIQIDAFLGNSFKAESLRDELIHLLVAEMILRSNPDMQALGNGKILPDWLRIGLVEAIEYRKGRESASLFSTIFKQGKVMSINQIFESEIQGMDSVSEAVYRTSCCGLILALLSQQEGPDKLRKYIDGLAVHKGSSNDLLEKVFPGTSESKNSMEKWWALKLAELAQPTVTDVLPPLKTEDELGNCLKIVFPENTKVDNQAPSKSKNIGRGILSVLKFNTKGQKSQAKRTEVMSNAGARLEFNIDEYRQFITYSDLAKTLKKNENRLLFLSYRAFPLHRPLIHEYQRILLQIVDGDVKGLDRKLARLAKLRSLISQSTNDANDYLNWYEATQLKMRSRAFLDYQRTLNDLNRPLPPRNDKLSKYLDEIENEFQ
ncbi:MAG: hypothetical protein VYB73_05280 [Verrucomicrobiota bacterium]|nr:hypothetical protein [Verrucomicrobiota bacterium]